MDGLETSEILLSEAIYSSDIFRLDSFFYAKEFLRDKKQLLMVKSCELISVCDELRSFGAYSLNNEVEYQSSGVPFIRCVNIKNGFVDFSDLIYINQYANDLLWKSQIKPTTVLLSMSGSVGNVAIAQEEWTYPINSNQDIAKIEFAISYNPYVAYVYMLSKFGQNFMIRESRGSVQQHVFLSQIEKMRLPIFLESFEKNIETFARSAHDTRKRAEITYATAEAHLLSALGLADFSPSSRAVAVKTFSESFGTSGRLDAEYYQTKYDDLLRRLNTHTCIKLGNLTEIKKSIEPGSDYYGNEGVPFIRVSDITKFGIQQPDIHIPRSVAAIAPKPKRDTILLSKDGSVGIAYKVEKNMDCITSGALLHLDVKNMVLPDYLTLVLNSSIVQLQAERDAGGSIIQHWKPSEIEEVLIPILGDSIQEQIAADVQKSFALRRKSEELLETAKHAVELAIEEGEEKALIWLSKEAKSSAQL